LEFLNVDSNFQPAFDIVNPNKQLRWPLLKKYTLDSPYFRKTLRLFFSDDLYAGLKNFYKDKLVKHELRAALDETFKMELMKKFRFEIEKLSDFLNRDLVTLWVYDKVQILDKKANCNQT
jgi:hypothetical protein